VIDSNIELCEEDGVFDVFGYLKKIRGLRRGLVETQDQYKFIYDSLEEYCRGIDSRFPVSDLANKIKEKTVKDKKIKKNAYAFEYAVSGRVENPVKDIRVSDILLPKSRSFTFAQLTYIDNNTLRPQANILCV
jgi:hypothetical protein